MTHPLDAVLFDAGGVLVLPDPTVIAPLLAPYGGDPSLDRHCRAHYAAMAVKSTAGVGEAFWSEYDRTYVASVGVDHHHREHAAVGSNRNVLVRPIVKPQATICPRACVSSPNQPPA